MAEPANLTTSHVTALAAPQMQERQATCQELGFLPLIRDGTSQQTVLGCPEVRQDTTCSGLVPTVFVGHI